ncbi:MAG: hypothetical protein V3W41_22365 [Planctomycetota bacterium]
MAVTINDFVGFEVGIDNEVSSSSGFTDDTSAGGPGQPGGSTIMARAAGASTPGVIEITPFDSVSDAGNDHIIGFRVAVENFSSAGTTRLLEVVGATGTSVFLQKTTGSSIEVRNVGGVISTITNAIVADDTHYYFEFYFQHADPGDWELFKDGVSIGSGTGDDLISSGSIVTIEFEGNNNASGGFTYYNDIYFVSGAASAADRLGQGAVRKYQSDKASATADTGDALNIGQWVDCGIVPFSDATVAEYTGAAAGSVDADATNGNPEGPSGDTNIDNDPLAVKGIWRMNRSGGGGSAHFGLLGNDVDGTTRSADLDPPTSIANYFFVSEDPTIVPLKTEHLSIGFETTGGQDFQCYGMAGMVLHIPTTGATTNKSISATMTGTASQTFTQTFAEAISAAMIGTASIGKLIRKSISAAMVGTADLAKTISKSISATLTGTATVTPASLVSRAISAVMIGTATLAQVFTFGRLIAATMIGTASVGKLIRKSIDAVMVGTAAAGKLIRKSILATMTGTASVAPARMFARAISAGMTGTASVVNAILATRAISAVMTGAASLARLFIPGDGALPKFFRNVFRNVFRDPIRDPMRDGADDD